MVAELVFESIALNTAREVAKEELRDLKEVAKAVRKQIDEAAQDKNK